MTIPSVPFSPVPRLEEVAAHIVHHCLRIKPGELVGLNGGVHQYWLLSQMSVEVRKAGGHPVLHISDDYSSLARVNEVPEEFLGEQHEAIKNMNLHFDVQFYLHSAYDPKLSSKYDSKKMAKIYEKRQKEDDRERKSRLLVMEWPTAPKAEVYGMTLEELETLFWEAFWIDLDELTTRANKLKSKLEGAEKVEITSGEDSVLHLKIGSRPLWIDTGCFTDELIAAGDLTKNLPCGEVYCSPLEDDAHGTILFQDVFYQGQWIRDLKVTFEKGTISNFEAREGEELFAKVLEHNTGDKDRIAELGIGMNPKVPRTMGNILLDEKVVGSIHVAIGKNTMYGGINKSSLHWDLVCMSPSIKVGDQLIMDKGKLNLD